MVWEFFVALRSLPALLTTLVAGAPLVVVGIGAEAAQLGKAARSQCRAPG